MGHYKDIFDVESVSDDEMITQICAWASRTPRRQAILADLLTPPKIGRVYESKECEVCKKCFFAVHHKDRFCSRTCADRARMGLPGSKERKAYNERKAAELKVYRRLHKTKDGRRKQTYY
jgi:hypothetical protein